MKMWILKIVTFLLLIPILLFLSFNVSAEAPDSGLSDYDYSLPEDVTNELYRNEITPEKVDMNALNIGNILQYLWSQLCIYIQSPLKLFVAIIVIVLISSFLGTASDSANDTVKRVFSLVCVLSCAAVITLNVSEVIAYGENTLKQGQVFASSFIPAFAGVISMTGRVTSATVLNGSIMGGIQLFMMLATNVILPLGICIMGFTLAGAVDTELKLSGFCDSIKKITIWLLGILMTIFVAMLGLQTFITSTADGIGLKATRFTISNAVPFIGGAISDALSVMLGGVGMIKGNFGVFGVIAGSMLTLPSILSALCYKLLLSFAHSISEMFGTSGLSQVIKGAESVISIVLALLCCFLLMCVICVSLMIFTLGGV
ncbi:MAG: stage III sporulation protein AE [Ruminiclostridium sp.]|nr:stage III sporulation protein AE [Ruminiclostridium sp.]